jgi:hypothetical protein
MRAVVFANNDTPLKDRDGFRVEVKAGSRFTLFIKCKQRFGPCVGSIYDGEEKVGWIFSKCEDPYNCEVVNYKVLII